MITSVAELVEVTECRSNQLTRIKILTPQKIAPVFNFFRALHFFVKVLFAKVSLSNIESLNSTLIKNRVPKKDRLKILFEIVKEQKKSLNKTDYLKSIKKLSDSTYTDHQQKKLKN